MQIDCPVLEVVYLYGNLAPAAMAFARSSAAGGAFAPRHLIDLLTETPATVWAGMAPAVASAWLMAYDEHTANGNGGPSPGAFVPAAGDEGFDWVTVNNTLVRLNRQCQVILRWPLGRSHWSQSVTEEVGSILESVTRRAITPLGLPAGWNFRIGLGRWQPTDLGFPLPAGKPEEVILAAVLLAERCRAVAQVNPPPAVWDSLLGGDFLALLAALDWAEEQA